MASPSTLAIWGASARTISSVKIACSTSVAPRPPYSLGQETPAQPASYSFFCQATRNSKPSSSLCGSSPGALASSHERSSSRKASSDDESVRSTARESYPQPASAQLVGASASSSSCMPAVIASSPATITWSEQIPKLRRPAADITDTRSTCRSPTSAIEWSA